MHNNDNLTPQTKAVPSVSQPFEKSDIADGETIKLLTEVGFLAIRRNRFTEASCIFETLAQFRPHADFPILGLALIDLSKGLHEVAIHRLTKALTTQPESTDLQSFLCLALFIAGHYEKVEQLAGQLTQDTSNPDTLHLLQTLTQEAKKRHSPLELCNEILERIPIVIRS